MVPLESFCHKEHTYEIPITYHSKYMANVKVFEKWVKLQGHKVKKFGTNRKVLSYKEHTYEIPITDMANVKFLQTDRPCKNYMPPIFWYRSIKIIKRN
jgi:hypothetical protein